MPPFIVLALPRSRTAWLSQFLTYGDWICGHEELRHWRSLDDVKAWFSQPCIGTAETFVSPWWRLKDRFAPDARVVIVRRSVEDVVDSLMRLSGFTADRTALSAEMQRLDRKLDQIAARVSNVLEMSFDDLAEEDACARVFEHCLPYPHDPAHWQQWAPVNVQINMAALARYVDAYRPALAKMGEIARQQTISAMMTRKPVTHEGMTIQTEPFDTWLRDARGMIENHLVLVGESPEAWQRKNLALMRKFDDLGALQIVTARSNGRMFGYLMSAIGPSFTSEGVSVATHGTFYADPDCPGLGLKLQRAAIRELKAKGVDEVFMQDATRGSGGRINAIYRRLGAANDGQVYRLQLSGA